MCAFETIWETIERNRTKKNKCIINQTCLISTYILNSWEITKIILTKQKSY